MKKSLLIKRILTLFFSLFVIWQLGSGQTLLVENFEYPAGDLPVSPSSAWVSANSGNTVQVTSGSLSYTGYLPGIGNGIAMATGLDYKNPFTSITSGSVYAAFLINVTSSTAAGDYFFHFLESSSSTYYKGRIWIKTGTSASKFYVGVAKSGTTPAVAYSANEFDTGTTYLLVLKYQINASTGDDVVTLYVNPDPISSEPASPTVTASDNSTVDATSITLVGLRQASANAPYLTLDGLRVATSWTDAISDITAPVPTFVPANSATDVAISVTPSITFDEAVVKADGSELTDGDLATLVTFKKTDAAGDNVSFTATIDATKKIITVTPAASLNNSQIYYMAVGPVKDAYGNQSTGSEITFTTIAAASPTVTLTNPVGGETFYATDPVTFTWTSENITNVLLEVFVPRANEWQSMGVAIPAVAGKLDFVIPSDAPYGTEYKIRISDASNSAVNSTSGNFTVIAFATSLTELRANCIPNDIVKISSEVTVTYLRTNRYQKYIQDSGKGLLIDDGAHVLTTTLAPGDNITGLEGKLGLYHGLLQLVPTKPTVTIASSGNIVTPTQMTIADYNTNYLNYESMLIKLTNATFAAGNGTATFAAATDYVVNDGVNTVTFRTFNADETDIDGEIIPNAPINITCIAGFYDATIQVYSQTKSEFELITAIERTSDFKPEIYPVPATDMLKVRNLKDIKAYEILDATGRAISKSKVAADNELNIPVSELKHGIYYVRFNTASGIVVKKFVK